MTTFRTADIYKKKKRGEREWAFWLCVGVCVCAKSRPPSNAVDSQDARQWSKLLPCELHLAGPTMTDHVKDYIDVLTH